MTDIAQNLSNVRERLAAAARRAGRNPAEITLVAVSKNIPPEWIRQAIMAGVSDFGENRAQELRAKYAEIGELAKWHFIGHLQTNKVKYVIKACHLLHSLDRMSLAIEIDRRARKLGIQVPVLLQVNISEEESKFGVTEAEFWPLLQEVAKLPGLRVKGLMTIAPFVADPETVRPVFRRLRELSREATGLSGVEMSYLSMGMSNDFEVAIEEGANIIRPGTVIFGKR